MHCKKYIAVAIIAGLLCPLSVGANENLDELMARKSRYATASFGANYLEDPTTYVWQPETISYTDTTTGHEVWILIHGPDQTAIYSKEYATDAWSADGSRLGAFIPLSERTSNRPGWPSSGTYKRWLVNTDGSQLKAAGGYANDGISEGGFGWAHTENAYYGVGFHSSWDAAPGMLIKNTVDGSNNVTGAQILDLNTADTSRGYAATIKGIIKRPISADDNWISLSSRAAINRGTTINCYGHMRVALNKGVSSSVADYWGVNRDITEFYQHLQAQEIKAHGGANWAWGFDQEYSFLQYSSTAPSADHMFFKLKTAGAAADGGPLWEAWDGDSYGANQIYPTYGPEIVGDPVYTGTQTPGYVNPYFNHPSFDVWEKYVLTGLGDDTGISGEILGPGIAVRNVLTGVGFDGGRGEIANDLTTLDNQYDGNHKAWNGWTDNVVFSPPYVAGVEIGAQKLYTRRLHFDTGAQDAADDVVTTHHTYDGNYNGYPRPSQSPDGTKIAFAAIWLNNGGDDHPYVSYAVAYYPHPPEITSVTGSGTYTIRFDWRTDQITSRGYTQRGWPDEATDDPPPPRETKTFRLWRSADGSTWTPINTVDAEIFNRYDFATGDWTGNNYWTITDTPGAGTFYYAVTAIEHSGLESRVLSNVFSTAGAQAAAYPADPKAGTGVTSAHQSTAIRYYNIYAEDATTPAATQQNRIASIPVAAPKEYVDWLGNIDGTTKYVVTAVDTQGNESSTLDVVFAETVTNGQYLVQWSDEGSPPPDPPAKKYYKIGAGIVVPIDSP